MENNNVEINTNNNETTMVDLLKLNVGHSDKLAEYLEELCETAKRLPTGIQELDDVLGGGLKVGGVTTLAGAPTFGKSTLALGVANNLSTQGNQVIYYTNDVGGSELILKLLSMVSYEILGQSGALTVDDVREYIVGARLKDDVWYKVIEAFKEKAKSLRIVDIKDIMIEEQVTGQAVNYIGNHLLYVKKEIKKYIDNEMQPVIVLDYLQTIQTDQGGKDKERIDYLMSEIKMLAIGFNLPILVVSSIARLYYDKAIVMEALKESGGIEYGSDIIIGIQHKGVEAKKLPEENKEIIGRNKARDKWQMELVVLKNKLNVADKKIETEFIPKYNYFGTATKRQVPQNTIVSKPKWN